MLVVSHSTFVSLYLDTGKVVLGDFRVYLRET